MVTLSPNLRQVVRRVYEASLGGTSGVLLEDLNLELTPVEIHDAWKILSIDKKLLKVCSDSKWRLEDGKHPVELTHQGRESAREIISNDNAAERQKADQKRAEDAERVERKRAKKWKTLFVIANVLWTIGGALVINHFDRKIERWEEQRAKTGGSPSTPTATAPATQYTTQP